MTHLADEQLVARLKSEPEAAFRLLYDRHSSLLFRFIFRFTGNSEVAEEVLHDTFLELLKGNFTDLGCGGVKPWLFTIAKNKSLNLQRRAKAESADFDNVAGPGNLEDGFALNFSLQKIAALEPTLPQDLLETWKLRQEGLAYQQIAEQLGIPTGTVKSRLNRLVSFFREEFNK